MTQRVLILHHVEPDWEAPLVSRGTSFEEVCEDIIDHIENSEQYDRIILTRWEDWELCDEHYHTGIAHYVTQVENHCYGWEAAAAEQDTDTVWAEGGTHSEVVPLYNWILGLQDSEVFLAGAFDGECIEDMEYALKGANVNFTRLNHLII